MVVKFRIFVNPTHQRFVPDETLLFVLKKISTDKLLTAESGLPIINENYRLLTTMKLAVNMKQMI